MGAPYCRQLVVGSLFSLLVFSGTACGNRQPPPASPPPGEVPEYLPTATIKDLMDGIVDPSADDVWNAVATIVDATGVHEETPKTDEEWENTRLGALRVMEGANLLMMPGRHVARSHEKSSTPDVELEPEVIEANINKDRAAWVQLAKGLYAATDEALKGIEKRDAPTVVAAGERMDAACESCHLRYWYPNQMLPPGYQNRN
jgi:hypothetical protein